MLHRLLLLPGSWGLRDSQRFLGNSHGRTVITHAEKRVKGRKRARKSSFQPLGSAVDVANGWFRAYSAFMLAIAGTLRSMCVASPAVILD
jgi:hypothetical protein